MPSREEPDKMEVLRLLPQHAFSVVARGNGCSSENNASSNKTGVRPRVLPMAHVRKSRARVSWCEVDSPRPQSRVGHKKNKGKSHRSDDSGQAGLQVKVIRTYNRSLSDGVDVN